MNLTIMDDVTPVVGTKNTIPVGWPDKGDHIKLDNVEAYSLDDAFDKIIIRLEEHGIFVVRRDIKIYSSFRNPVEDSKGHYISLWATDGGNHQTCIFVCYKGVVGKRRFHVFFDTPVGGRNSFIEKAPVKEVVRTVVPPVIPAKELTYQQSTNLPRDWDKLLLEVIKRVGPTTGRRWLPTHALRYLCELGLKQMGLK